MVSPSYYILLRLLEKIYYQKTISDIRRPIDCSRKSNSRRNVHSGQKKTCRICLKEGNMPIYGVDADLSEPIRLFGAIKIHAGDQYAKHICLHCYKLLKCAILFRKLAGQSDEIKLKVETSFASDDSSEVPDGNDDVGFSHDRQQSLPSIQQHMHSEKSHSSKATENNNKTNILLTTNVKYRQSAKNQQKLHNNESVHLTNNKQITPVSIEHFFSDVMSDLEQTQNQTSNIIKKKQKIARVKCKICQKIVTKGYSKEHYVLHDPTMPKHVCHICGKSFRQKCSLINHKYTHSTEFNFQCKICPYRGRSSMLLKMHMRSHTKDYKFVCTKCPGRFTHKSNLNRHSLLRHTKPLFKCDTCPKEFHTKVTLQQHITGTHLGIKNHLCNVCDGAFACRKGLMRHQLDVHKREKKAHGRKPDYMMVEDQEHPKQKAVAEEE